jgi:BirA family transcriptional regulator, biotin operon repressor / biotin---[acetyl-CoA-carboxylase] ligase
MQLDPIAVEAGMRLEALGATDSTNAEARQRARHGETGPLWITAAEQTQGRGRQGRTWISPPGNLYASLLLTDPSPFDRAPELAFVAVLALRDAIVAETPALAPELRFKWPNDLLLFGAKCAGILIEGEVATLGATSGGTAGEGSPNKRAKVIIGIGVNCVTHPAMAREAATAPGVAPGSGEETIAFPATDLRAHGADIKPEQLFRRLSATMCRRLSQWDRGRGVSAILGDWITWARGIGEEITVREGVAETHGRFVGLDQSGRLVLGLPDGGTKKISAGDVFPFEVWGGRGVWGART